MKTAELARTRTLLAWAPFERLVGEIKDQFTQISTMNAEESVVAFQTAAALARRRKIFGGFHHDDPLLVTIGHAVLSRMYELTQLEPEATRSTLVERFRLVTGCDLANAEDRLRSREVWWLFTTAEMRGSMYLKENRRRS